MGKRQGVALGLGVASVALIAIYFARRAGAAPEEPEEPEPGMANLYGRVTNSSTGQGIAGVKVTTTGAITLTDSSGDYAALDIPPGEWSVRFEKAGYETKEVTLDIQEGNNEYNTQLVPEGGEEPPEEGVDIGVTVDPTTLTSARHEYETSLGLGFWGDPFTISITFSNPFDFDVWVKPDFGFGHLNGEPLEFVEETQPHGGGTQLVLHGFTPEELLYFRLLLNTEYIQGDYSYTTAWQKMYDARGTNAGSNMAFVYDPDGVPRAGDERWLKIPAGGSITTVKEGHLGSDLSVNALQCVLCGEIITGGVEAHYASEHPGVEITCWSWGGLSGCYFDDGSGNAVNQVYVPAEGVVGIKDVCVVAWRAIHFVYDPGCGTTRVGGQTVTLNWRLEELSPIARVIEGSIEIVPA